MGRKITIDAEILDQLKELEILKNEAFYKLSQSELTNLDDMPPRELLKLIAGKLILINNKLNVMI